MLVLRRNPGQSIVIGRNAEITVKVLNDSNGVVTIGIDAPKDILVDRLEIHHKRHEKKPTSNLTEGIAANDDNGSDYVNS